jgi:hypothetical protein
VDPIVATEVTVTIWIELVVDRLVVLVVEVVVEFQVNTLSDCIVVVDVLDTVVENVVEAVCALIGTLNEETRTITAMTTSPTETMLRRNLSINLDHLYQLLILRRRTRAITVIPNRIPASIDSHGNPGMPGTCSVLTLTEVLTAVDVLVKNAVDTELATAVAVALCTLTLVEVVVPEVLTVEAIMFVAVVVVDAVVVAWLGPLPPPL